MFQNDFRNAMIQRYGCYFLCLFEIARREGKEYTAEEVEKKYYEFVKKKWISEYCYIINPVEILGELTQKKWSVKITNEIIEHDYIIARVYTKYRTYHFLLIDKNKNILYDSDKFLINTNYVFVDYRIYQKNG